jgi:hypothetical protein
MIFPSEIGINVIELSQPKSVKPKMRECKLRSDVNYLGALKQSGIKQMGITLWKYSMG